CGFIFTSCPSLTMARTSPLERSAIEHRSSPASRAAAARISGSFCTGTAGARRSMVALLATVVSSFDLSRGAYSRGLFGKNLVQCLDRFIYVLALDDVGRQEP